MVRGRSPVKWLSLLLSFAMLLTLWVPQSAKASQQSGATVISGMVAETVDYYENNATVLDSWWSIVALWGAGADLLDGSWTLPDWHAADPGLASDSSDTEHIRYIFGLLAMRENPANAWETNRNLLAELAAQQNEDTGAFKGSLNKHMWAMLALDAGLKLELDVGGWDESKQAAAVNYMLSQRLDDGGYAFYGTKSDPDMTGMGMLALGNYRDRPDVAAALEGMEGLLHELPLTNDGYRVLSNPSMVNSNSMAAAVTGLVAAGENMLTDYWSGNGSTMVDSFQLFRLDNGAFKFVLSSESANMMATDQLLIALQDMQHGKTVWHRLAEAPLPMEASIEVVGRDYSLVEKRDIKVPTKEGKPQTALDVLTQALDADGVSYEITQSSYGPYVKSINGEAGGSLGGWDGWMYEVNGVAPWVSAGDYVISEQDEVRFYYLRWPMIRSVNSIVYGGVDPVLQLKLHGDEFTAAASDVNNWNVNGGGTGLTLQSVTLDGLQRAELRFGGSAASGGLSIQASQAALVSGGPSDELKQVVPYVIPPVADGTIAIDASVTDVVYSSGDSGDVTNTVKLQFSQAELPRIDIARGGMSLQAEMGTQVLTTGWDGLLQLPQHLDKHEQGLADKVNAALAGSGKKLVELELRMKAGGASSMAFDRHVTLRFAGLGHLDVGYIDASGSFTPIAKYEDPEGAQDSTYAYNEAGDLIVKTNHFTQFLVYSWEGTTSPPDGGGTPPTIPVSTVTISVEKRSINEGDIVASMTVKLQSGDTAYSVLKRTLEEKGISLQTAGTGASLYVQGIDGLMEKSDHGELSGWMYAVNGAYPPYSAGIYVLEANDVLRWQYTKNMGEDLGAGDNGGSIGGGVPDNGGDDNKLLSSQLGDKMKDAAQWISAHSDFSAYDSFLDWDALSLARAGEAVPSAYYRVLSEELKSRDGELRLVTDYERMALAVTALGRDATNVAGYDLIRSIYQNVKLANQGTNGGVFALLALDSGDYAVPADAVWTRESLLKWVLEQQNADGGFPLSKAMKNDSSIDMTAMALQALAPYEDHAEARAAIEKALQWLSKRQLASGAFQEWNVQSSESVSQVIIALASLGIDPQTDKRFVKRDGDLLQVLLQYVNKDGGVSHEKDGDSNGLATQQALMAFTAYKRLLDDEATLYDMREAEQRQEEVPNYRDEAEISPWALEAVAEATRLGFMEGTGVEEPVFQPKRNLTRAQFAALVVKYAGEKPLSDHAGFQDVEAGAWYSGYVAQAKAMGWINGISASRFAPNEVISRQEMAVIIARIVDLSAAELAERPDDRSAASEWAREAIDAVYASGLMTGDGRMFKPQATVTREMAAVIIVRLHDMQAEEELN